MSGNAPAGNANRIRSIYGRGYSDGLMAAQGGGMTPKRQQQLLQGQSSIARKVFDHVPIRESWPPHRIAAAIERTTRSRLDAKVVDGCLAALIETGLIRQHGSNTGAREYQRTPVSEAKADSPTTTIESTPPADGHIGIGPVDAPGVADSPTPFAVLSSLNERLFQVSQELKDIATGLGDAVLQIEEAREQNARDAKTLRQLQSLLGSLSAQK